VGVGVGEGVALDPRSPAATREITGLGTTEEARGFFLMWQGFDVEGKGDGSEGVPVGRGVGLKGKGEPEEEEEGDGEVDPSTKVATGGPGKT
jgi:hypothetical protein